mmetsp:Transcript_14285/g.48374  ORF Transcript_14285/g.48374 Transcript_14285/m.48374 type:complete len:223 (-) Transcript_14285:150-818(-)
MTPKACTSSTPSSSQSRRRSTASAPARPSAPLPAFWAWMRWRMKATQRAWSGARARAMVPYTGSVGVPSTVATRPAVRALCTSWRDTRRKCGGVSSPVVRLATMRQVSSFILCTLSACHSPSAKVSSSHAAVALRMVSRACSANSGPSMKEACLRCTLCAALPEKSRGFVGPQSASHMYCVKSAYMLSLLATRLALRGSVTTARGLVYQRNLTTCWPGLRRR